MKQYLLEHDFQFSYTGRVEVKNTSTVISTRMKYLPERDFRFSYTGGEIMENTY